MRRTHTEEKRIRALVSQQERATLLVRRNDSGGQAIDAFLTKKMMSDECRHGRCPFLDAGAIPRDNVHASIMPRCSVVKRQHDFFVSWQGRGRRAPRLFPERFRSAKREDQPARGAAGAPSFLPAPRFQGRGRREARGRSPERFRSAKREDQRGGTAPGLPTGRQALTRSTCFARQTSRPRRSRRLS